MCVLIRKAQEKDIDQIVSLCEAHAAFEGANYSSAGKGILLSMELFKKNPRLHCLVADHDNRLLGYATYTVQYSTLDACQYLYMDCLYLHEEARGKGLGKEFMGKIIKEAKRLNCELIQWQTPTFNTNAIAFYKNIGGFSKPKERFFLTR